VTRHRRISRHRREFRCQSGDRQVLGPEMPPTLLAGADKVIE
jgi:hypothetical protein